MLDIVAVLTDQNDYTKTRNYWKYLKAKLKKENSELVSATTQLKLLASDGKRYLTDMLDYKGIIALGKEFSKKRQTGLMEVSPLQISKIVRGKENLTLETQIKLQSILDIPIRDLCSNQLKIFLNQFLIHHRSRNIAGGNRISYGTHHTGIVTAGENTFNGGFLKHICFNMAVFG